METPHSSTSRSKLLLRVVGPLACAALGLFLGAVYMWCVNPENQTRLRQIRVKKAALARTAGAPRVIVAGDSSVAFGIDPVALSEKIRLPAINLGFTAGCGALALMGVADVAAQRGDTVILSFHPGLVMAAAQPEHEGRVLATMYGYPPLALGGREPFVPAGPIESLRTHLSTWSPGERLLMNDIGRVILRLPGYRYESCELDPWGYFIGKITRPHPSGNEIGYLDQRWRPILVSYRSRLQARGVRLFFTFPWHQSPPERTALLRRQARAFQAQVSAVIPVLEEPDGGVKEDPSLFADTDVHLSVKGGRLRSEALAAAYLAQEPK